MSYTIHLHTNFVLDLNRDFVFYHLSLMESKNLKRLFFFLNGNVLVIIYLTFKIFKGDLLRNCSDYVAEIEEILFCLMVKVSLYN